MKTITRLFIPVFAMLVLLVCACQKYVDKQTKGDPRLTNPYCNDPNAVNYNVGFPGKPDNTICFYPNDLFVGKYFYIDSIFQSDLTYTYSRIDTLYISSVSHTALRVIGFCAPGDTLRLTAGITYVANLDTTIGTGQPLCRPQDTVSGTISKNLADTGAILHVYFQVVADTGTTLHIGTAKKL
jgi:hypothetical protein